MKLKKDHEQTLTWVIAIHTAWYCAEDFVQQYKRCGNSWGCPAVSKPDFMKLKPYFAKGILLYIYGS